MWHIIIHLVWGEQLLMNSVGMWFILEYIEYMINDITI